jgi:uncharacterized LabA/DUF88 family protein
MDRVAVFVDAGYLFAQGTTLLTGRKLVRGEVTLDHSKVADALQQFAERVSGLKLLRIYWYDGTSSGPTPQHIALAYTQRIKLRLGFVNSNGQQKGVDSLIVTDMLMLARNRAMSEAVLLSGDEDLRVGVQQAQEYGALVHLVGIKPARGSQSVALMQEADMTYEWSEPELTPFLTCMPRDIANTSLTSTSKIGDSRPQPVHVDIRQSSESVEASILRSVASEVAAAIPASELQPLVDELRGTRQTPKLIDGKLLAKSRAALDGDLNPQQKKTVRSAFVAACVERLAVLAVSKVRS